MRTLLAMASLTGLLLATSISAGQDPDYVLRLTDASGVPGDVVSISALLDNFGDPIDGWSYGVCHEVGTVSIVDVDLGSAALAVNGGGPPDFFQIELTLEGWATVAVIDFSGVFMLPPGTDQELNVATYQLLIPFEAEICFCDTIGDPPQPIFIDIGPDEIDPVTQCANVVSALGPAAFDYIADDHSIFYLPSDGMSGFTEVVQIRENPDNPSFPTETSAFTMSLAHDGFFLEATSVTPTAALDAVNDSAGPDLFGVEILDNGVTIGVIYSFSNADTLNFAQITEVARIEYETQEDNLIGNLVGGTSGLIWDDDLAAPPQPNLVFVNDVGLGIFPINGLVTITPVTGPNFLRADCNTDARVDVGDGIAILRILFSGLPVFACPAACDANMDGNIDIGDAVYIFSYLFLDGPDPLPPFPDCGPPEPDEDCDVTLLNCMP